MRKISRKKVHNWLEQRVDMMTRRLFDVDNGKLKDVPTHIIFLVYIMCLSVVAQGVADVVLKVLTYTTPLEILPWRVDFLFLTGISVLIGIQTLRGMKRRELDVTRNSVQIGLLVEIALVVGDLLFIQNFGDTYRTVAFVRSPFVVLTTINILILGYFVVRLDLFRDKKGKVRLI
jgi:hypothetical protein